MQILSSNYMQNVTGVTTNAIQNTPADGDDMTWREGYDNAPLAYAALVATVYRLQNEMHGLAAQVVEAKAEVAELRKRVNEWEGD